MTGRAVGALAGAALLATACSEQPPLSPGAEHGRQVYLSQCTSCHHPTDPTKPGAVGPEIRGLPRAVLEAKMLRGNYPDGYTPKRPTRVMPPMPQLAPDVDGLAEFLK